MIHFLGAIYKKLGLLILLHYKKSNVNDNQYGRATSRFVNTTFYGYKEYVDGVIIFQKKTFQIMVGNSKSLSIVLKRHEEFIWNRLR